MWLRHLTRRHRKVIWTVALLAVAALIPGIGLAIKSLLIPGEAVAAQHYANIATIVILCGAGAWLINQGLKIFLWEETYVRVTGMPAPAVMRGALSAAIYLITVFIVLSVILNLDLSAVLVSTGLVAAVLGVAMQSTIADFFSGISLGIDKPYGLGDWIEFEDGTVGEVVDITWRSTRIRSWNASIYVVPNKKAASSTLHNYQRPTKVYGYWFHVLVNSEVSPLLVRQWLLEAALRCKRVLDEPAPIIYFSDLGTHPFKYMVFVHFPDYSWRFAAMDELFLEIHHRFSEAGISPAAVTYEIDTRPARSPTVAMPGVPQILRNVPVFAPLSDAEIDRLADDLEPKDVRIGEVIMEDGEEGASMFVLITGIVALSRNIDGEWRELERLSTDQCFGEMSLLTGEPRFARATALTNVRLIEIPKSGFAPILAGNEKLHEELARIAAARRARSEALQQALRENRSTDALSLRAARLNRLIRDFFRH